jgi:hypothetical protein
VSPVNDLNKSRLLYLTGGSLERESDQNNQDGFNRVEALIYFVELAANLITDKG